jgi:wobble nucleotide-excising tRNase
MSGVASYKNATVLETDKRINLIYGLNGSGKSTISDYLYNSQGHRFNDCSIEGLSDEEILVYNQRFINDYFYEPANLKGIFTLSKENKEAEENVRTAEKEIDKLEADKKRKVKEKEDIGNDLSSKKQISENIIWRIKSDYTGGDRVLEYCLEGLKSQKEKLFTHITAAVTKPSQKPEEAIEQLKREVESIQGDNAQSYNALPHISFSAGNIEKYEIFAKQIIGNENSTVSEFINKLSNSDWVKEGRAFLPDFISENGEKCPFCQKNTITTEFVKSINEFFDDSYENDVKTIRTSLTQYESSFGTIKKKNEYENNPFVLNEKNTFENLYNNLINQIEKNITLIKEKASSPSKSIELHDTLPEVNSFNQYIDSINVLIDEHNKKITNKEKTLNELKGMFWSIMRWDYDQTIEAYLQSKKDAELEVSICESQISEIDKKISLQKGIITSEQKKTVNIGEAVQNINNGLLELGIDGFRIEKHNDSLYKLARTEKNDETFQTLSEGEKMIISFLYFLELCKGKKSADSVKKSKIIVIDDPISSLSHIYVFNVGRLIKKYFFGKKNQHSTWTFPYEQVFILTHSLYFFYEITETKPDFREATQKLFRLSKNDTGSTFHNMKYEEIQNDYQAYWYIVKDEKHPPALIANSMRNIIEYFFNFVEKKDLNNFFRQPIMEDTRFQAFYRYINRESHSLGQNVFDYKEFNYNEFKEAFATLFKVSGYEDHYKRMMQ